RVPELIVPGGKAFQNAKEVARREHPFDVSIRVEQVRGAADRREVAWEARELVRRSAEENLAAYRRQREAKAGGSLPILSRVDLYERDDRWTRFRVGRGLAAATRAH